MKYTLLAALSVAVLTAFVLAIPAPTTPPVTTMTTEVDYTTLPPTPDVVTRTLADAEVKLDAAIATAKAATKGLVAKAAVNSGECTIDTYGTNGPLRVIISMTTGEIIRQENIAWIEYGEPVTTDWTTTKSGLMYAEIVQGTGDMPPISNARVTVHYSGWLLDGTKFDSSVDRGQPATFPLHQVIAGWTEGVGSMKIGGKRKLVIPSSLAYGPSGRQPSIPAKATLVFDVELLAIK